MRYPPTVALLLTAIAVSGCGPGPTMTAEPVETPDLPTTSTPGPTLTPTAMEDTSPAEEPTEIATPPPTSTPTTVETATPEPKPTQEPAAGEPQLRMVIIRAKSPLEVEQLRRMRLDIVRVSPVDSKQTPASKADFLQREFIVEAVVTPGLLAKLKAMGFEISEVP